MPTIFTHEFAALVGGKIFSGKSEKPKFYILSALAAIIPDADVIAFRFGIPYGAMLGHRGFSHSILFAPIFAAIIMFAAFREKVFGSKEWFKYFAFFFFATLSHGLLDALTNGGLGVGFFIPFDDTRYFFPFRPVEVSPIGISRFLDGSAFHVLASEFLWIWLPLIFVYLAKLFFVRFKAKKNF